MERLPLKVNWRVTYDCDNWRRNTGYGCVFCYSPEKKDRGRVADHRQILQLIRDRGARIVVLTGGEPLCHPGIQDIIQFLRNHEILVNLSTNGLHLKEKLPGFCDELAVISLPLDGPSARIHDGMRNWDGHFDRVVALLEELRERTSHNARIPKVKIETVLGKTNSSADILRQMAELLKNYPISIWKLFEYNYYPDRSVSSRWHTKGENTQFNAAELGKTVSAHVSFAKCCSKEDRSECYFMLNPNGTVVLPTLKQKDGSAYYEDDSLGDFVAEPDETIRRWEKRVDLGRFADSLDTMYRETYELLDSGDAVFDLFIVIRDPLQKVLWKQIRKCDVAMIYETTDDFATCRVIGGEARKDLLDYLKVAKREVCIIAHLLKETVNDISGFFHEKIASNAGFTMTIVLPDPESPLAEYMSQSRCKTLHEDYKVSLARTVERLTCLSDEIKEKRGGAACSLEVYTLSDVIPYASVVMIDDERIQVETKFPTLDEDHNVILEFVRRRDADRGSSYFSELRRSVEDLLVNHARPVGTKRQPRAGRPRTFIVHGQDDALKLELKNYVQNTLKLGEPIILHEQPSMGRTIIEKFEHYAEDRDLVFVLLTPDDVVATSEDNNTKRRARQNVVFELGYFLAKLERRKGKVIVLYKGLLELPSDIQGLVYIDVSHGIQASGELIRNELQGWLP